MTLAEAERRARSNLYRFEENTELLERKEDLADMIREHGSRVEQQYEGKSGKASTHYVEAVPSWFLALDDVERVYFELLDAVSMIRGLTKFLQEHKPELFKLYEMKYKAKAPIPEVKRRFGQKLKGLDRDLIFRVILWHSWPIEQDGGEEYEAWLQRRGF